MERNIDVVFTRSGVAPWGFVFDLGTRATVTLAQYELLLKRNLIFKNQVINSNQENNHGTSPTPDLSKSALSEEIVKSLIKQESSLMKSSIESEIESKLAQRIESQIVQTNTVDKTAPNSSSNRYGWYTPRNQADYVGGKIVKVGAVIAQSGTLTVAKVQNPNSPDFRIVQEMTLQVEQSAEIQWFNVDLGDAFTPSDFLSIYKKGSDTALFKFGGGDDFGGFYSFNGEAWNTNLGLLNIGYYVEYPEKKVFQTNPNEFLKGKKLAILGDSISTFKDHIQAGFAHYYPKFDVDTADKTWFVQLCKKTGAKLVCNGSFSGSRVSSGGNGSLQNRLNILPVETDICLIFLGTNDLGNNVTLTGDNAEDMTVFSSAYEKALLELSRNYPKTKLIVLGLMKRFNRDDDYKNTAQLGVSDFDAKIIEVCKKVGVQYLSLNELGITKFNKNTYLADGLHPNAEGMVLIADYLATKLRALF